MQKFICSCPGKVLLAGGYAILNPANHGISIAINARFETIRTKLKADQKIVFISKQFNQECSYQFQNIKKTENKYFDAINAVIVEHKLQKDSWVIETNPNQDFYSNDNNIKVKAGLGSSACLIVSCLGQFCQDKDQLYKLSQEANMIAQNNVGSGFDISTAIYGSQLFSKQNIQKIENLEIYQILMIDLHKGQNTVQGVNTIQSYLKSNPNHQVSFLNESENCVQSLNSWLKNGQGHKFDIQQINQKYRAVLRELGEKAQYEIEPQISKEIIDFVMTFDNSYWGICPGAGGYDAIAILCKDFKEEQIDQVKGFLHKNDLKANVKLYEIDQGIQYKIE